MADSALKILESLKTTSGVSIEQIEAVQNGMSFVFPQEYRDFLTFSNGAVGPIGRKNYIQLWSLEDLSALNEAYAVTEFAPGLFLFGSDGGNEAYGFDRRVPELPVIRVPFIGMDLKSVVRLATTFNQFLQVLAGE